VFIDDVIIFSKTAEKHAAGLENEVARFDKANLQLHPWKYVIAQPQVNYSAYVLSENGVSVSVDKVKAVQNYATPSNAGDVGVFLDLASIYRRLVTNFAVQAKTLRSLTWKNQEFVWGSSQLHSFDYL